MYSFYKLEQNNVVNFIDVFETLTTKKIVYVNRLLHLCSDKEIS